MDHPLLAVALALSCGLAMAATTDLGNGFRDHGVGTPISNHRGIVATVDGDGTPVVLCWLYDHRGGYALMMADAETGRTEIFDLPYNWKGDGPFASILSSKNKFYSHYGSHFIEFDPVKRAFTFHHQTVPQMAMSMTEDDRGRIWSATYPNSAVAMYDPASGEFKDYGNLYEQNWRQYQRSIAADDTGWIYFAVGNTRGQVIALNPETGEATPMVPENQRKQGSGYVYRDKNGKVYGKAVQGKDEPWFQLYQGKRTEAAPEKVDAIPYIASSQSLFHRQFPNGDVLQAVDLVGRELVVKDGETGEVRHLPIEYPSEGAHLMGVAPAANGTVAGGTAFPMRFFSYNPADDSFERHPAQGQWNIVEPAGDLFYAGAYGHGILLEWDTTKPWVDTKQGEETNPRYLVDSHPDINRPHALLAMPGDKWVILAGTPGYGYTGGGLHFWNRETQSGTLVKHTELLENHSTMSLEALEDGKVLGGTTVSAGTGGEQLVDLAELYILDPETKRIEWHEPVLPGVKNYMDLWRAPNGLVYGIADSTRFFAFDPRTRTIVHEQDTTETVGRSAGGQGCRLFIPADDGTIYVLYRTGIAKLDTATNTLELVAESPVGISVGGAWLNGRVYFGTGSHIYSWQPGT